MALGEAMPVVVHHQRAVIPLGTAEAQCAVKQNLPRGGFEQIGSANYFGNAHRRVIRDAGELIAGHPVPSPYHEVSKILPGDKALRTQVPVLEFDYFAVGNAEPPIHVLRCVELDAGAAWQLRNETLQMPARSRIDRLVIEVLVFSVVLSRLS